MAGLLCRYCRRWLGQRAQAAICERCWLANGYRWTPDGYKANVG